MGRVKLKNRARGTATHDTSLPLALDAKQRVLSGADFHHILSAYQSHAEAVLACPCEGIGNPLLIPPDLSRDEVETARSAALAYVGALSWQKSVGVPGIPAISEEFRTVLGDMLRPLQCRYLQIGINGDTLRIASEDILPGEPFGLVTRIDVDQGYPSLHVVRSATTVEARHKMETTTMLAYLTPDETAEMLFRIRDEGASVKYEMLDATRVAVGRGYAIPGAGGEVERWFRTHRSSLDTAPDTKAQAANFLAAMTGGAPVVASEATVLETLRGTGILALSGHTRPTPLPNPEKKVMPIPLAPASIPTTTPTARDHLYLEHQQLVVAHFERGLSPEEKARLAIVRVELDLAELAGNANVLAALDALATSQERLASEIQGFVRRVQDADNLPRATSNHNSSIARDFLVPVNPAFRPSAFFLAMEARLGYRDPSLADYCCACGCDLKKTPLVVGAGSGGGRRFACEPCWNLSLDKKAIPR